MSVAKSLLSNAIACPESTPDRPGLRITRGLSCLLGLTCRGSVRSRHPHGVASTLVNPESLHCRLNVSEGVRDSQLATHAFEHEDDQYTADDAQYRAYAPGQS